MTIDPMKNIGTAPSDFAVPAGVFATGGACARSRSTLDRASVVSSSTAPEITNGSRGSWLRKTTPR